MKITFRGGFGEKGRTCVEVDAGGARFLLDCGIDTAASGAARTPDIDAAALARLDAIFITHAHEDHVAAIGWALAHGFRGRVLMTRETREEMGAILAAYADAHETRLALDWPVATFEPGETIRMGEARVTSGRSGHAVGGVWFRVEEGGTSLLHCGDVVPHSSVLAMDALAPSDVILFDASYGADPVPTRDRVAAIRDWLRRHRACLLPTPLLGRSIELLALIEGPLAIHESMRLSMAKQIAPDWLHEGLAEELRARLDAACDWRSGDPFPDRPLLVHDAMGLGGPSADAIPAALRQDLPILFTGHLPAGSPGAEARKAGRADWLRLPTHPTWDETLALIKACGARVAIPHSTDAAALHAVSEAAPPGLLRPRHGETLDF